MTDRDVVGRYQVGAQLAAGVVATVFDGREADGGARVVIKRCRSRDRSVRRKFLEEADRAASLEHPHVVRVLDLGMDADGAYLVEEHVPGPTLRDLLAEEPAVDRARTMVLLRSLAAALEHAHARGVLHGAVRPGAVRAADGERPKLGGFGLNRLVEATAGLGAVDELVAYLAPEQVLGRRTDMRADLFAFGAVGFEMLTGRSPFAGLDFRERLLHVYESTEAREGMRGRADEEVVGVLERCLRRNPRHRPGSFEEVAAALGAGARPASGQGVGEGSAPPQGPGAASREPEVPAPPTGPPPFGSGDPPKSRRRTGPARWREWAGEARAAGTRVAGSVAASGRRLGEALRRLPPRIVVPAVVVLLVVLGVTGWLWSRGPVASGEGAGREELVEPPPPPPPIEPAAAPRGRVRVVAAPWGKVVEIFDGDGRRVSAPPDDVAPLGLELEPGSYRIIVTHPRAEATESCDVEVVGDQVVECRVTLTPLGRTDYFRDIGWWP